MDTLLRPVWLRWEYGSARAHATGDKSGPDLDKRTWKTEHRSVPGECGQ